MFDWLPKKFTNKSSLAQWSVSFEDGEIVTSDGVGDGRKMKLCDLTRVVVAIGDGYFWDADVFFVLYSREPTAACLFPMEAKGRDNFVAWMSTQPGYKDRELARAICSTRPHVLKFWLFKRMAANHNIPAKADRQHTTTLLPFIHVAAVSFLSRNKMGAQI